ncbi:methyltransferase domain-containing protein [Nocardioides sp. LHD-245]|uniref:class I SAM-dependent methyltransferase n=1 Tax=Nocardioides sp. LHD-245 TaxID=3051387 RepID=UPI0027E083EE|nr:methyltransferase domain-containing protein [Nocardioides sp. LHD-245]
MRRMRRRDAGFSNKEILRKLKRAIAREVFDSSPHLRCLPDHPQPRPPSASSNTGSDATTPSPRTIAVGRSPHDTWQWTGRLSCVSDVFSEKLAAWRDYTRTPWARIRYGVVGDVLRRQTEQLGEQIRILDVGGGDGMDALPLALAGHDVTVVDPSEAWLGEAQRRAAAAGATIATVRAGLDDLPPGEWDLVMCHFVLRYRDGAADDIGALARRVRPGGRLSLMDVNPDGRVLRELLNGGPAAALEELKADRAKVETFRTSARKVSVETTMSEATAAGLTPIGIFGNRIANDLLVDNTSKHDPAFFEQLLALELELCDREPFNRVGFAWQLVLEHRATPRPGGAP